MKYVPPAGEAAGTAYVDGNRSAGTKGSVVPAGAIEYPQREIDHVIEFFGPAAPSNTDLQQLRKAIEAAIAAATGGGDTSQFLLVSQARARLPIFPEILSADGKMIVTSPAAGTVQVPTSVNFQHRGIYPVSTSSYIEDDRTFTTLSNKTYHLRWNPTDGFLLKDLADGSYNPAGLAETDTLFDSTYDDMLVARVATNASNIATITNLVNSNRLIVSAVKSGAASALDPLWASSFTGSETLNWSRTPVATFHGHVSTTATGNYGALEFSNNISARAVTRYSAGATVTSNWNETAPTAPVGLTGALEITAFA
ncbi:hypothetical protein LL06_00685 [Hoeflea sp. BAL378]|uniref:hypothetical protein n=1 Tax=Hoeflea sp. BAL378 TaxID=1547437 RepID=UPI000513B9A4|nr:hypothetical protein [Hoeflea sp. BAL378]KGF71150.1 hypothetical protein LL06_00685 [Hoeflea sp. BAL378]